eukprot:COSAG01_NODE_1875_length_8997_cov_11.927624_15_plen_76_part_00
MPAYWGLLLLLLGCAAAVPWPEIATITFTHNHMRPTHGGGCNSNASELPLVKYIIYARIRVRSIHNIEHYLYRIG